MTRDASRLLRGRTPHTEPRIVEALLQGKDSANPPRPATKTVQTRLTDSVVIGDATLRAGSEHFKTTAQATHGEHERAALDRAPRPLFKRAEGTRKTAAANKGAKMRAILSPAKTGAPGAAAATPAAEDAAVTAAAGGAGDAPVEGAADSETVGTAIRPWTDRRILKETVVRPNTTSSALANVMAREEPEHVPSLPPGGDTPPKATQHVSRWHDSSDGMAAVFNVVGNQAEDRAAVTALRERAAVELSKSGGAGAAVTLSRMVDGGESAMVSVVGNRPDRLRRGRGAANPEAHTASHFTLGGGASPDSTMTGLAGKPTVKDATAADVIGFGAHPYRGAVVPGAARTELAYARRRRLSLDYRGTLGEGRAGAGLWLLRVCLLTLHASPSYAVIN